ncbi:MAG: hypothetical protein NTV51_23680 [Verrucomicrobia bacterium]|nr:hypothetical protein [Verrucomicrobiota bacterium]
MLPLRWFFLLCAVSLSFAGVSAGADSPMTEWKDPKGAVFRGEPAEALGPLALFRTGGTSSKFMPMRVLSPEDCVRFYQAVAGRPARAAKWSEAQGRATAEFVGRLVRSDGGKLKPVDLTGLPEPELLLVVFRSRQSGGSWLMVDNLGPFIGRIQRVYPGRVATVFMSTWEMGSGGLSLPSGRNWLIVDPKKQADMKLMSRFVPGGGFVMMLMTREGVPLFGAPANDVVEVMRFVDGASDMLWQLNPANPRTARDRAHYLRAVRPVEFAAGKTGPLLLADMFRVEGLRQNGIASIEAKIAVAADGKVAGVELLPEAEIPAPLRPAMIEAIRRSAAFVPAVENGVPVAGSYDYSFKVGPADKQLAADAAWVNGEARVEVPLKSWLILKPVKVPEQVFGGIDRVGSDGTVMMKAVTAGDPNKISKASQVNSFNNDWFTEAGAGSVRPSAGDKQEVDGTKLVWKKVTPEDALVDFLGNADIGDLDYCIGYAWTEFESAADTDAWLGIGSDDGLKIWLNGELVNDQWVQRTSKLDDDVVPLRLKKGRNQILIKIQNMKGRWSFTARLRVRGS